jgi:hypothetical protein
MLGQQHKSCTCCSFHKLVAAVHLLLWQVFEAALITPHTVFDGMVRTSFGMKQQVQPWCQPGRKPTSQYCTARDVAKAGQSLSAVCACGRRGAWCSNCILYCTWWPFVTFTRFHLRCTR